ACHGDPFAVRSRTHVWRFPASRTCVYHMNMESTAGGRPDVPLVGAGGPRQTERSPSRDMHARGGDAQVPPVEAPTAGGELVELSRLVESRIPEILARWERAARAIAPARRLSPPALRDDVASLIARIAAVIRTGDARLLDEVPEAHALERLAEGFDLGAVVAE